MWGFGESSLWAPEPFLRGSGLPAFTLHRTNSLRLPSPLWKVASWKVPRKEEAVQRTVSLLREFGYTVLDVGFSEEDNQAHIRMEMASRALDQALWNQLGVGFDALKRVFPEAAWLVVQLVMEKEYVLSFQVKAYDFDIWRRGYLSSDEFWKKRVLRYVYNIRKHEEIQDVRGFYSEKFGVVF